MGDIGDATAALTDAEFRAFILILAEANEQRAQERGDSITVGTYRLTSIAPNKRGSVASATRVLRELCAKQAWAIHESDASVTITLRNWSKFQGFAPANSVQTPATTPTTTTTTTPKDIGPTLCPDPMPPDILEKIAAHLVKRGTPRTAAARKAEYASEQVRDWSRGGNKRRKDWAAVTRRAIDEGWALKGWVEYNSRHQQREAMANASPPLPLAPKPGFAPPEEL